MNVIVIEDQILFRDLIVSMLKKDFGLNVLGENEDGESALAAFFEHRPDMIVLILRSKTGRPNGVQPAQEPAPIWKVPSFSSFHPRNRQKHLRTRRKWSRSQGQPVDSLKDAVIQILKERFTTRSLQPTTPAKNQSGIQRQPKNHDAPETDVLQMVGEGYSSKSLKHSD